MRSFLASPELHASSSADPAMFGGPFLNTAGADEKAVKELLESTVEEAAPLLRLADAMDHARRLLRETPPGRSLSGLYGSLDPSLRGFVELVYDSADHAQLRFFESLLYRSHLYDETAQSISIIEQPKLDQPFIFSSPVLSHPERLDIDLSFTSPELDDFLSASWVATDPRALVERLELTGDNKSRFLGLFTDEMPRRCESPVSDVRLRYFGHACVLIESSDSAILIDPLIGYAGDGFDHFTIHDVPDGLDAVVLTHSHPDHVSIETLLRLRHRVRQIIVPQDSSGNLVDPGIGHLLERLGFPEVRRLHEMESIRIGKNGAVTALPFLGEHADLDIRSKMLPLVQVQGRCFLFATDSVLLEPMIYEKVGDATPNVDALFISVEPIGASLSWLYGPLLDQRPSRQIDQERRINGSDAAGAARFARLVGANSVYVYAMGLEPWFHHLLGTSFKPGSPQMREVQVLLETCRQRGTDAEMLYSKAEVNFSAT